ncbi:calymmin isoform X11 [Pangasianodon hypophthalmus]|uniref:calymmin isoform X11 n=1 Tax=Pangasianodon hypophthalmus TaxID=310915 RepID=UPI002306E781|nr:calymmin isoform X11 [Pangasianodon hypophthalmus]
MLGRAFFRAALLLCLAQPTIQGGTGYKPQNGGLGQMLMPSKGYSLGAQNANAYQPNTKAQGYGPAAPQPNGNGAKGYGAAQAAGNSGQPSGPYKGYGAAPNALGNGNGAKPNGPYKGYGAAPNALGNGNGAKPNGPYKGYGVVPASLGNGNGAKPNGYGNGGKPNGFGAFPGAAKGNGGYRPAPVASKGQGPKPNGYGASPFTSNGQQAKANPNGGYGSKPNKPGYGAQPSYGGFGAGMRTAPQMANKGRGGYGKGNGFGHANSAFTGYRNGPAAYPQAGAAAYPQAGAAAYPQAGPAAYPQAGAAAYPQAGAAAYPQAGPAAYPQAGAAAYPQAGAAAYPQAGPAAYPQAGAAAYPKTAKPGYGGGPLAPSGRPAKPKGYGPGNGGPNAQGAKPAGYGGTTGPKAGYGGYPNGGGINGPKPGYGGLPTGYGQRPNGYGGYPNGAAKAPKPGYGVGVGNGGASNGQGAKPYGYGVPAAGVPKVKPGYGPVTNGNEKGPKGKSLSPEAPSLPPVTGYTKGVVQPAEPEPTIGVPTALPPTKGMPLLGTSWKGPKPQFPVVPQGYPSKPIVPEQAPVIPQNKGPKSAQYIPQGQALIPELAPIIPQGKGPKPAAQPAPEIPQGSPQKPFAPALLPFAQQEAPKPITQVPQPAAPVYPQGKGPNPVALQPAVPQGYGPGPWYPNSGGAKASKPGQGYGPKPNQPGYVNPAAGYGYGNGAASLGEMVKGKSGGAGQLPYNGAPIIPARLDAGTSPIQPQTAELGPEVKSGHAYGGPYGAQPMGLGSEGKPQVRYGIGGILFGGSPMGYNSNPYGTYGNPYAAQPYGSKEAGNYNPLEFANPKSAAKYRMGGSLYTASPSETKASGKYGPYGGQQLGLPAVAGNSGKYGNPSLPFGPVTDGQTIDQSALQYEAPAIDGVKSVDQFGDGEVQPQPIAPLVDGVGEGPASYVKGGVRAEAVSLPAAPTDGPFTGSAVSLGNPAYWPVDTPTEAVTPQHIPVQQNLKGPQLPQDKSWTGGKELKRDLKGFFGNGYHG